MNILTHIIDALEDYDRQRSFEEIQQQPNRIEIRTRMSVDDKVAIHITDNGLGISEESKAKLFAPFFTTKSVGRNGLGLSISYEIVVKKHGGNLYCQSTLGKGTEFIIEIPIKQQFV